MMKHHVATSVVCWNIASRDIGSVCIVYNCDEPGQVAMWTEHFMSYNRIIMALMKVQDVPKDINAA